MRSDEVPVLEPIEAYQLWAQSYDNTDGNALLFAESSAVGPLLAARDFQGKAVLDAGCGTGRNLELLVQAQPRMLVATDFASKMIEKVRANLNGSAGVHLQVARLEFLPYKDGQFDFVLCTLVLGHVLKLAAAVAELSRVLRPRGSMVISCFHPFGQLLSWQRTFNAELPSGHSKWFAAKYYYHPHAEYFDAFQTSHLEIVRMIEPAIDETLRPFYEQAGRMDIYNRYSGYPLLLIFEVQKL